MVVNKGLKPVEKGFAKRILENSEFDNNVRVDVLNVINVGNTFHAADDVRRETYGQRGGGCQDDILLSREETS